MEQQGAAARYANCGDDENSQAEGTSEGAVGYLPTDANANSTNNTSNPHYENIYESIDAAAAAAPAENMNVQPNVRTQNTINNSNNNRHQAYRNELYDRTAGYDVPRQVMRQNFATNSSSAKRHLHLDLNPNRPRYTTASRPHRQRSFDDTESYHYNNFRYENIYEQIHEEPIYRNASSAGPNSTRLYGRLGVIGHGIGRIERHLSSSCGNIDHYNLGGHYAVLGHSHLGTVGHIRLNTNAAAPSNSKDASNTKSLNFFSCLSRENSQSMTNIHREASASTSAKNFATSADSASSASTSTTASATPRPTGTIPKTKIKNNQKSDAQEESTKGHDSTLNRISKSSLQWLLVNKWLPLWIGQGPDYNILDFNFMFSRNCGGCSNNTVNQEQGVVRFNGHAEMRPRTDPSIATRRAFSNGVSGRPMRINHSLNRLREYDHPAIRRDGSLDDRHGLYDRPRHREEFLERSMRARSEGAHDSSSYSDPFRNWELNTENNSFRPAASAARGIRRITDGTYPSNGSSSSPAVSRQNSANQDPPAQQPQQQPAPSKTMERVYSPRLVLDSRTESGNESPSPDMGRRYSDNTEDDQNDDDRGDNNNSNDDNENSV